MLRPTFRYLSNKHTATRFPSISTSTRVFEARPFLQDALLLPCVQQPVTMLSGVYVSRSPLFWRRLCRMRGAFLGQDRLRLWTVFRGEQTFGAGTCGHRVCGDRASDSLDCEGSETCVQARHKRGNGRTPRFCLAEMQYLPGFIDEGAPSKCHQDRGRGVADRLSGEKRFFPLNDASMFV